MKDTQVAMVTTAPTRLAFRFTPESVRALVPGNLPGVYLLLDRKRPVYVGRSDNCVRTRLSGHPLLGGATHFVWEPCRNAAHAFLHEAHLYHRLRRRHQLKNSIHPARPASFEHPCPFCDEQIADALRTALGRS